MRTETVTRVRGNLDITTLAPAEPWSEGNPNEASGGYLSGWRLYLPDATDLVASDRVVVRGSTFSVLGDPADWLGAGVVAIAADLWTATCAIRHPGGAKGPFDTATGTYPITPFDPHYSGECRIQVPTPEEQERLFGEEPVTSVGYVITVDLATSTDCKVGDLVKITGNHENGDPAMVDKTLTVLSFARGTLPWTRELHCTYPVPKA